MFHIPKNAITKVFDEFLKSRDIQNEDSTLQMYENSIDAFDRIKPESFERVYKALHKWRLFRNGKEKISVDTVFETMKGLNNELRNRCLSGLTSNDWPIIRNTVLKMKGVKPLKDGISIMAISKFLHFWNPKLFVICDGKEIEQFVFGHKWLMKQRDSMDIGQHTDKTKVDRQVSSYLKLLALASDFIKSNPSICGEFARSISSKSSKVPGDIETYEARAIEWFLIGLAESPPSWWENA